MDLGRGRRVASLLDLWFPMWVMVGQFTEVGVPGGGGGGGRASPGKG